MLASLLVGSDLDLDVFQRVAVTLPLTPGDTVSEGRGLGSLVQPVEVAHMTTVVPPCSLELMTTRWHIGR